MVERSGDRSEHRSALRSRRSERRILVADPAADARRRSVPGSPRLRLQPFRARRGWRRERARRLRRRRGSGEVLGPDTAQPIGAPAPPQRHRLRRVGPRRRTSEDRHARRHGDRCGERRDLRAQPIQHRLRRPRRVLRCRRRDRAQVERRPRRVPRPQRHARRAGRDARAARCRAGSARRSTRARRSRSRSSSRRRREARVVFRLGVGRDADEARELVQRFARRGTPLARRSTRCASTGTQRSARCRSRRPMPASTCSPTAGCSTRRSPAACGRAAAFYQSGGAFGFRDQLQDVMALVHAAARARARSILLARGAPVRRRRRAALVASAVGRGVRTRCSDDYLWLPFATCRYVKATGDTGVLDETVAVPRGPAGQARRRVVLRPAAPLRRSREPLRALRARDRARAALRRARPAADGIGRLERRHEPRRHRRPGRERLARLLPVRRCSTRFAAVARAHGDSAFAERCEPSAAQLRGATSSATGGTASGTGAPTSTTARRSARRATTSAGSIRSRRAGRCSRARGERGRARRR